MMSLTYNTGEIKMQYSKTSLANIKYAVKVPFAELITTNKDMKTSQAVNPEFSFSYSSIRNNWIVC